MPEALSPEQIEHYRAHGYLVLEGRVPAPVMNIIRAEIARLVESARGMTASDDKIDLEDSHMPEAPRVRRVKRPDTLSGPIADLMRSDHVLAPVRDLIGPDVRLQTTKLNMKSAGYGAAVEWHQDWAFYPYTNDDVLAVGLLIDDMDLENGPLMVFPGTHRQGAFNHHHDGVFAGAVSLADEGLDPADAVPLMGPAGSISIHHARVVHGSALNQSARDRRIIFYEMMAADAFPIAGGRGKWEGLAEFDSRLVCGTPTLTPRVTACPMRISEPDAPTQGSIYEVQKAMAAKARSFDVVG
ncbi:MAG: phytanoyl-CoA dioxygenase family protein [Pseudomonadota bacterium]